VDIEAFPVTTATVVLVVGHIPDRTSLPRIPGFHFRPFQEINRQLLVQLQPDVVLSALIGRNFDAVELARVLADSGFDGRYRAVTERIPNRRSVVSEVRATAPEVDFDLFVLEDLRLR